jgi:cytochrome oxidase assembly protein ShyY1
MAAASGLSPAGTLFFSSLCASTFGLGCWQAQRYVEKIEQIEQREEESHKILWNWKRMPNVL